MKHILPHLPYPYHALEPYISKDTLYYHHGKHHQGYVDALNKHIEGTEFEHLSLEEIIKTAPSGKIFNNAAQVWNHTFYFEGLIPGGSECKGELALFIQRDFGSFQIFMETFQTYCLDNFGSGWTWLAWNISGKLEIVNTSNAGCLLTMEEYIPLLVCDVWEHAYYLDTKNARGQYVMNFFKCVNWKMVEKRLGK